MKEIKRKIILGILVDSNTLCGISKYCKNIANNFPNEFEVILLQYDSKLLRESNRDLVRRHLEDLSLQIKKMDVLNIHFEPVLFGSDRKSSERNFLSLARATPHLVLTLHSYFPAIKFNVSLFLKSLISRKKRLLQNLKDQLIFRKNHRIYRNIIQYCKRNRYKIVVHNKRDRNFIIKEFEYSNVFDHPLSYYDPQYIDSIRKTTSRSAFCKRFGLNPDQTYLGMFGFINAYKGHYTALKALSYLPQEYQLLIFGGQHPFSLERKQAIDPYIDSLLCQIHTLKLEKRVKFFQIQEDEQLLEVMIHCDFHLLPYLEEQQAGSAVAALCLEVSGRCIFSKNTLFLELEKYAPQAFQTFSIGNYLELANAIQSYNKTHFTKGLNEYQKKYNINSLISFYKNLFY